MSTVLNQKLNQALRNENLRGALTRFGDAYLIAREKAYHGIDWPALRQQVRTVKEYALQHLSELIEQFAKAARQRGAVVFQAVNAEEAREYIACLAEERGVKNIVKSKSMASEEIHLNEYLVHRGFKVWETDLGEWIIQLSGQRPSHMVMPAIHMTRQEVAEVFSQEVKKTVEPDISQMVRLARQELREKFLTAEMGISGANIAVAETGSLFLLTNEGNARLTTTLPPLHVALVGIDKLVARLLDTFPILTALPRSATGQLLTSYLTVITGVSPAPRRERRQPAKELHIVLLDNGRRKMLNDPVFREAMRCIRCASCLNVCPVFQLVGGHVYGHIYTGGIGTVLTAFLHDFATAGELQSLCLGCARCREFCPAEIDIPNLLAELRRRYYMEKKVPAGQRFLVENVLANRSLFHRLLRVAAKLQKPLVQEGRIRHLPLFLAGVTENRTLPPLAEKPLREREIVVKSAGFTGTAADEGPVSKEKRWTEKKLIGFFSGCLIDFVYPEIGEAIFKTVRYLGWEIVMPLAQGCCGYPARVLEMTQAVAQMARQNLSAFVGAGVDVILAACPTCALTLKKIYPEVLKDDPAWAETALIMAAKVSDFSSFALAQLQGKMVTDFINSAGLSCLPLPISGEGSSVTYHDPCHLRRGLGIYREPRAIIEVMGLRLREMSKPDACCGFGGSYTLKFPALSAGVLERKLADIVATGANAVITDCPGCILQISGGLEKSGRVLPVLHTAQLLASLVGKGENQNNEGGNKQ